MNPFKSWFRQSGRGLKCAAVTPVGPGHAARGRECRASIEAAWHENTGTFSQLDFFFVDDGAGSLGRSKARNVGVQSAHRAGADWIFFLDADDLMTPQAFSIFSEYSNGYDAVWGLMAIKPPNEAEHHIRFPQALTLRSVDELLLLDPFMTLLMGHFVRTSVALQLPFDESMDAGEDFDYYIRAWEKFRCIKVAQVLSVNRSDLHSSGPRSATADQWRTKATARLSAGLEHNSLHRSSSRAIAALNRCSEEAQAFSRARDEATPDSVIPLSRRLPYRGFVDVNGYAGGEFVMFNNNDDPVALNIGWTGEYAPASARLWQALAAGTPTILDIGASTGYFGLLAARAAPTASIVCLEPLLLNYARLELNLALNDVHNVRALRAAAASADAVGALHVFGSGDVLPTDSTLHDGGRPFVRVENVTTVSVDNFFKQEGSGAPGLIRIDSGGDEDEIMAGMAQTLSRSRPDLLIAISDCARVQRIDSGLRQHGYQLYGIDENSSSVVILERLPPGAVNGRLFLWATTRSRDDVTRILASAYCDFGSVADC
jgi:FkbM family methyltransferase